MANKVSKTFRLSEDILKKINELQIVSDKDATEIIENTLKYVHGEYIRKQNNKEYDKVLISQILG
jgi:predicted transcriptional regulator